MYFHKLVADIEQYIEDEIKGSMFYSKLAEKAPTNFAREILKKLSSDEKGHVENFKQAYYYLTGKMYLPGPAAQPDIPEYETALKLSILSETDDYKRYGEQYLDAPSKYFKDLFFKIRTVEAQHAMRIPILFDGEDSD